MDAVRSVVDDAAGEVRVRDGALGGVVSTVHDAVAASLDVSPAPLAMTDSVCGPSLRPDRASGEVQALGVALSTEQVYEVAPLLENEIEADVSLVCAAGVPVSVGLPGALGDSPLTVQLMVVVADV